MIRADFCDEDGIIQSLLDYKNDWAKEYEQMIQGGDINIIGIILYWK